MRSERAVPCFLGEAHQSDRGSPVQQSSNYICGTGAPKEGVVGRISGLAEPNFPLFRPHSPVVPNLTSTLAIVRISLVGKVIEVESLGCEGHEIVGLGEGDPSSAGSN